MIHEILIKIFKIILSILILALLCIIIIWTEEHEPFEDVLRAYLCIGVTIFVAKVIYSFFDDIFEDIE